MTCSRLAPFLGVVLVFSGCVGNQAPTRARVLIGPSDPGTLDDLEVSLTHASTDPEGEEVTYTYAWFSNGFDRSDLEGKVVPAAETAKGDLWRVIVTPSDGTLDGPQTIETITIGNTPPTVEVSVNPESPSTEDDVEVEVSTSDDDQTDVVSVSYSWTVNGAPTSNFDATLPASETAKGEVWEVQVAPDDGEDVGATQVLTVAIGNTPPVMESIELSPDPVYTVSTVVAVAKAEDGDGDAVAFNYAWSVDGSVVQDGELPALGGGLFSRGQVVTLTVTPTDGYVDGDPLTSDSLTVANTPPTVASATVDPAVIYTDSILSCVGGEYLDADGDTEGTPEIQWVVNTLLVATGDTVDSSLFEKGDQVVCWVIPNDGTEDGPMVASDSVTVSNTAPSFTGATLSTTAPVEGDTLAVTTQGGVDLDGDTILNSVVWSINGIFMPTGIQATLNSSFFAKGDTVYALVSPNDGVELGVAVQSDTAVVANTAPEVTAVSIAPALELYTDSIVNPVVTSTDVDGDTVTYTVSWSVNGVVVDTGGSSVLYGDLFFSRGDSISLEVTPSDGVATGNPVSMTSPVVVVNKVPITPSVALEPSVPSQGVDDLVCTYTEPGDVDGDTVTYTIVWRLDGALYAGATDTNVPGDTIDAADTTDGDVWTCHVTPNDGFEDGGYGTDEVDFSN